MTDQLCVICRKPGIMTLEHVYPEAIGGAFELQDVCKNCNVYLGDHVDYALTDHLLVQLQRFKYKVAGKKGTVPNPLLGTAEDQTGYKSVFETTKDGRVLGFRQLPRVRDLSDSKFEYSVDSKDSTQLIPMIKKHLERQGIIPASDNELLASIQTSEEMKIAKHNLEFDLTEFQRPIAKIAFGLALAWLGKDYIKDEIAKRIKGFLFDERPVSAIEDEYKINGQVTLFAPVNPALGYCWDEVWKNDEQIHLGLFFPTPLGIMAMIRVFNAFYGSILISRSTDWPCALPRLIVLDSQKRTYREFLGEQDIALEMKRKGLPVKSV